MNGALLFKMSLVWFTAFETLNASDVCSGHSCVSDFAFVQFQTQTIKMGNLTGPGDFLVVAATHGAGSTMLSEALAKHPCIISIGEPFSASEKLYAPSGYLEDGETALFRDHGEPDPQGTFAKLAQQINEAVGKEIQIDKDLHMQTSNIMAFFAAVRKVACANYDLIDACGGRCIFSHKLFPDYVANDFLTVQHYVTDERTAVFHLMRNESDVAASNGRRFNGYSDWKITRDLEWHDFLTNLGEFAKAERNWLEIHAEDMFRSPADYFAPIAKAFENLHLDTEELVAPVRDFIEFKFAQLAASDHTSR